MANINEQNTFSLNTARRKGNEVAFSYSAKSDGHERVAVGTVYAVTGYHVTLFDRIRDDYRVFILDRIRGRVMHLR